LNLELLHLCDSLFPIGAFAYSDGLESATARLTAFAEASAAKTPDKTSASVDHLRAWLEATLDETIGRMEGPAVWQAWAAFQDEDVEALRRLDEELTALRPSSSARQSSRAMGLRLLTTWKTLHPDRRLERVADLAREGAIGPVLPLAFAAACASSGVARRASVEAFAYTRLAATVSAAMRLMPIGQTDAHLLLSRALERVPAAVDRLVVRDGDPESFTPMMDIAAMTQQYLHSRLFRS
jgi:urease accessory protein